MIQAVLATPCSIKPEKVAQDGPKAHRLCVSCVIASLHLVYTMFIFAAHREHQMFVTMKPGLFHPRHLGSSRQQRLLCALSGIICAVLVYALVFVPQDQPVAETSAPQNYFIRRDDSRCRTNAHDECWMANKCSIECGTRQVPTPCCYEGIETDWVCELCELEVTPN